MQIEFHDDRYFTVDGVTEGELELSEEGCYVSANVVKDDGNYEPCRIGRFYHHAGKAEGLAIAKRWLMATLSQYPTGTALYKALNPNDGEQVSPAVLVPVPPPGSEDTSGA